MEFSNILEERLQELRGKNASVNYVAESEKISQRYRDNTGGAGGILSSVDEVLTYAQVRMPATYACVRSAIKELDFCDCKTVLDVGAGTGAGVFALSERAAIEKYVAIEKESSMIEVSRKLTKGIINGEMVYINQDVMAASLKEVYDVVLAAFVFNELTQNRQAQLIEKLWKATGKYLIIIDPGKPENFKQMMQLKALMHDMGAELIAPCMNAVGCPLLNSNDWCHFIARTRRSSIHRIAKGGSLSYEDEKFTYLVFAKDGKNPSEGRRVLRRPELAKGRITHTFCTPTGIEKKTFTKSQKAVYRQAKDLLVGEKFIIN